MTTAIASNDATLTGLVVASGFETGVDAGDDTRITELLSGSPVAVTGDRCRVASATSTFQLTGNRNRLVGCVAQPDPLTGVSGPSITITGDANDVADTTVLIDDAGHPAILIDAGEANSVHHTRVYGGPDSGSAVDISGAATLTRLDTVDVDPDGVALASRITAADGTASASETKEWGYGATVVTGVSVILRAWRDLHLYRLVLRLNNAGSTDTDIDVLVNGGVVDSVTIAASATSAAVHLDLDLDLDDEVQIEVTAAGTSAAGLSAQAELIR